MIDSYIAVDLEMSGLNPKEDRIIEIGALKVKDGVVTDRFETFVNPGRELDARIKDLTGITDEVLVDAPVIKDVIGAFVEFCEDLPLLGHSILSDYSFLKKAAVDEKLTFEKTGIDTLRPCRQFMPAEEKKTLESACRFYGIEQESIHRASADAEATMKLYELLKERYGEANPEFFDGKPLIYKIKREQPASERQKKMLRELIKYHKIEFTMQIDSLSRNEVSRICDRIIFQYGRMPKR